VTRIGAVVVCLALLSGSSSGAVWCRGEDGHLRLERGGDSCCEHAVGRVAAGVAPCESQSLCTDASHLEGCGNCVDVPLTLGADTARSVRTTVALAVLPASSSTDLAPRPELVSCPSVPAPLRGPASCQSVLRL
jgi:hypothetical protein